MIKRLAYLTGAAALATLGFTAAPAFAATCPDGSSCNVTATVSVPSSVTVSGLSDTVSFGSTIGGTPITVTNAEQYTVTTNDSAGYTLQVTPAVQPVPNSEAFCAQDDQCFQLNGHLAITETSGIGTSIGTGDWPSGTVASAVAQTIATTHVQNINGNTDAYAENWTLTVPANQEGGNYSESFLYAATGN